MDVHKQEKFIQNSIFFCKEKKMLTTMWKKRADRSVVILLLLFSGLLFIPQSARTETLDELKATIQQMKANMELLQQKVAAMEKAQQEQEKSATQASDNGSSLILPKDTKVKIYGYAKLDAIYTDTDGGGKYAYSPKAVPLDSQQDGLPDNSFFMHARQTRLGIATSTSTDYGMFKTKIEGDLFGAGGTETYSNSYGLRLRRAYGELGHLLVGQEWSTFIDLASYAETVDFGGPAGSLFIRQPLIRWTQPMGFGSLQFALENPESTFTSKDSSAPTGSDGEYIPDIIVRANVDTGFGHFSLAAMGRQLIIDDGLYDDDTFGGAASFTAVIPTFNKDKFRFQFNYGNALGRYMEAEFADAFINPVTRKIETNVQFGGLVAYQHFWTDSLRSTLIYSYAERDNDLKYVADTVDKSYQSVHANLFWSPVKRINFGLEYIWAMREVENGEDGDINRLQFGFQYLF